MTYKVYRSQHSGTAFMVLAEPLSAEAECLIAFSGPNAEQMAEEYARWKNDQDPLVTPPFPTGFEHLQFSPATSSRDGQNHASDLGGNNAFAHWANCDLLPRLEF